MNAIKNIANTTVDFLLDSLPWKSSPLPGFSDVIAPVRTIPGVGKVYPMNIKHAMCPTAPCGGQYKEIFERLSTQATAGNDKHRYRWLMWDNSNRLCYVASTASGFMKRVLYHEGQELMWEGTMYPTPVSLRDILSQTFELRMIERDDMAAYVNDTDVTALVVQQKKLLVLVRKDSPAITATTDTSAVTTGKICDSAVTAAKIAATTDTSAERAEVMIAKTVAEIEPVAEPLEEVDMYPGMTSWDIKFNMKQT